MVALRWEWSSSNNWNCGLVNIDRSIDRHCPKQKQPLELEVEKLQEQLNKANEEKEELRTQNQGLQTRLSQERQGNQELQAQNEDLQARLRQEKQELQRLLAHKAQLEAQLGQKEAQTAQLEARHTRFARPSQPRWIIAAKILEHYNK